MAKKSKKKSDKKAKAEEAKRLKAAKKATKAAKADAKKAKAGAKQAKGAKPAKGAKGAKDAEPAKDATTSAPAPAAEADKPDQVELLKLALRSTEAKLVDAEHRLRQVQQQLDDERRQLADASGDDLLEDALVDAAVEATVAEVLLDAEAEVLGAGLIVSDAELVEVVAEQLDEVRVEQVPVAAAPEPSTGEAEAAAEVFVDAGLAVVPPAAESELTPPIPAAPDPGEPNASWTLLKLREEAKRRGLQSTSSLPKAALLERLQQG